MANQEMQEKILNKKFKKTVFAGYDTVDVDSFFDLVIDYLKANDNSVEVYKQEIEKLRKLAAEYKTRNDSLTQQLAEQVAIVKQYEADGYANVHTNKLIQEITKQLKNKKQGE